MAECECLVLGPEGVGKTLLLKKLKQVVCSRALHSKGTSKPGDVLVNETLNSIEAVPHTLPTAGTILERLQITKGLVCTLRECGGSMGPIWSSYYQSSNMIVYMIDSSNSTQISIATMLLLDLLSAGGAQNKPILILFNKREGDQPSMSLTQLKSTMRLNDILAQASQPLLQVVEGSCVAEGGLDGVIDWITQNTVQALRPGS